MKNNEKKILSKKFKIENKASNKKLKIANDGILTTKKSQR